MVYFPTVGISDVQVLCTYYILNSVRIADSRCSPCLTIERPQLLRACIVSTTCLRERVYLSSVEEQLENSIEIELEKDLKASRDEFSELFIKHVHWRFYAQRKCVKLKIVNCFVTISQCRIFKRDCFRDWNAAASFFTIILLFVFNVDAGFVASPTSSETTLRKCLH